MAKLTAEDVLEIRQLLANGTLSQAELAQRFGVTRRAIYTIGTHRTWAHLGGPKTSPADRPRTNTGYWGVTANGAGNRYSVLLRHEGRVYTLGITRCPHEAARRYDAKARELGLPVEKLNFPNE